MADNEYGLSNNFNSGFGSNEPYKVKSSIPTTGSLYTGAQTSALSDPKFTEWATGQGIDLNNRSLLDGAISQYDNTSVSGLGGASKGLDWGIEGVGGTVVGLGQLGLGVMSYLDQKKTNDLSRKSMEQEYMFNNAAQARLVSDKAHVEDMFKTRTS